MDRQYNNGVLTNIFNDCKKKGEWNCDVHKDYFFLVLDKGKNKVIINSVLGLSTLTKNKSNLPFQVKWKHNLIYNLHDENPEIHILSQIQKFLDLYKNEKLSWQEKLLQELRL